MYHPVFRRASTKPGPAIVESEPADDLLKVLHARAPDVEQKRCCRRQRAAQLRRSLHIGAPIGARIGVRTGWKRFV